MAGVVRSMTGFARVQRATEFGEISISVKGVNHRGLDLHFHLGPDMDVFENAMRSLIKRKVIRGHIDVNATIVRDTAADNSGLNEPLLKAYLAAFRKIAAEEGLTAPVDLNAALRLPGMFNPAAQVSTAVDPGAESAVLDVLAEALDEFNAFRTREGTELAEVIREHNRAIAQAGDEMAEIRSRAVPLFQERLHERLRELLRNNNIDPQRLAQEAALLSDRSDIGEEIARLKIHSREVDEILDGGGEVGKRIDFLLQEMNREANTTLSKTSGIGEVGLRITDLALATKSNIEKIREQALNLE